MNKIILPFLFLLSTFCSEAQSKKVGVKATDILIDDSANFASIKKADVELPLLMKLNNGKKMLTYFGTYHTNDPNDSLFIRLQNELNQLQPDYVLFEGVENPPLFNNTDSTIIISGEPGYIIQYAK